MKILTIFSALFLLTAIYSCQHSSICTGTTPTYTANVKPILDSYCAMPEMHCHGGNGSDINLSDYAGASQASKKKSFMGSIEHRTIYAQMPKGGVVMPIDQIRVLSCWVENGSPE
ncbi:MAG: hypothetical protein WCK34_15500 [Bacteroidota bacterium]